MGFEGLLKRLSPVLKRIAYKLSRRSAYFGHDDLYQEELLHLWQEFQRGTLGDKTDSYILQGCYFYLKNYIRKSANKAKLVSIESGSGEGNYALEEMLNTQDYNPRDYFQELNDKMLTDTISNNGLTVKEKYILSLCSQGLTTRQIGKDLGVSHVRIVKILGEIRQKCRRYLDEG